ncbi:phosphopantetheine adenylyltransferase [Aureimonas sp. Leaf454]|uniref:pantetheine-phosphate adenylyltransferase n=1 Tax=Aureimonas sp. Leaf454 TaxID=1736381 RepID=UPI000701ABB9|nr:pantetheine-phosphate adenylyltransferase [Aureimonas sp. Leaf454]KQT48790.1 phosphopantetheine adenylyltransferase [Aureimonas sp. Leaf454]
MRIALYPGSFDPLTNGHLDILRQAMSLFDRVVVAVGVHPGKTPLFDFEQRADMIRAEAARGPAATACELVVSSFTGLVVEVAKAQGATALVRGIRDGTDLDYEMQMAGMNGVLAPGIVTIFLPSSPSVRPITATLVRQIAAMGGDVTAFVPPGVAQALNARRT